MSFSVPIVVIVFNRPELTKHLISVLEKIMPLKLYVIADGARESNEDEKQRVSAVRDLFENLSWNCDVRRNYSEVNLGCRARVVSGLDWVFLNENSAIILEDDCIPEESFFAFCNELLEKYEYDPMVSGIAGTNIYSERLPKSESSYIRSQYPAIWGWATWKRVWNDYEPDLPKGKSIEKSITDKFAPTRTNKLFWGKRFASVASGNLDAWDYQMAYKCMKDGSSWIVPKQNLISNIGFGVDATHTFNSLSTEANLDVNPMKFPLNHTRDRNIEIIYDELLQSINHRHKTMPWIATTIFDCMPKIVKQVIVRLFFGR